MVERGVLWIALPAFLVLALIALALHRRPVGPNVLAIGATFGALALDAGLIAALPEFGLSFGPVLPAWLLLALMRLGVLLVVLVAGRLAQRGKPPRGWVPGWPHAAVQGALSLGVLYAFYFAPFDLRVTHIQVALPGLTRPLRVAQVSDLHLERATRREAALMAALEREAPDLIVLTGDYLNLAFLDDPQTVEEAREIFGRLQAPYGVYAVSGNVDRPEQMRALFDGLSIAVLEDEGRRVGPLYLVGVSDRGRERDREVLRNLLQVAREDAPVVLLYHSPDLIETASEHGVALYLAGHTHGGQVRLPIYGALVTLSAYGKRYEAGLYRVGPTTLYVSRGIGMEGFWFTPRIRLFCPPELVILELVPA